MRGVAGKPGNMSIVVVISQWLTPAPSGWFWLILINGLLIFMIGLVVMLKNPY